MQTLFPTLYVAAVAAAGFGIGLYLHTRLNITRELKVALPSPFKDQSQWVAQEVHGAA